jgi:NAD(P)-dependent dehydrogenase (short-subunit alcohol dehydrogenase family)
VELAGRVAVITGAAGGIGRALAERFAAEGVRVVLADRDRRALEAAARTLDGLAVACDVAIEGDVRRLAREAEAKFGRIDVFVSNAGVLAPGGIDTPDAEWERSWKIHVMAHVYAARAVLEEMLARGEGYFVVTASAAGLLNIVESASYGATKHAALAFAEWLAIAYGRKGLRVSCLCPQAVRTGMLAGDGGSAGADGTLEPAEVAEAVVRAMREERFLILPHPQVLEYFRAKAQNYERWIGGMQKIYLKHGPQ